MKTIETAEVNETLFRGAAALAAIFAGIALLRIYAQYIKSSAADLQIFDFLRPLVLLLLVANFNSFVLKPWQYMAGRLAALCDSGTQVSLANYTDASTKALEKSVVNTKAAQGKERWESAQDYRSDKKVGAKVDEFFGKLGALTSLEGMEYFVNKMKVKAYCGMTGVKFNEETMSTKDIPLNLFFFGICAAIANLLMYILSISFQVYAKATLYILSYVGILSFTLGIFEPFKGSIAAWLGSYLKVSLWIPLFHLMCSYIYSVGSSFILNSASVDGMKDFIVMLASFFVMLIMTFRIDTISDMIVSAGSNVGSGGAGAATTTMKSKVSSTFSKVVG